METSPIVVLVTGEPVPEARAKRGSFVELIRRAAPEFEATPWVAYDVRGTEPLPDIGAALAVIVTGSPASVTERSPWIERTALLLRQLVMAEVPVLGICFGHQLLAHALGGRVAINPRGREIGTVAFRARGSDLLFSDVPSFIVNSTHVDSVLELPPDAELLGETALEPHAAARFGPWAWGVQFHPEIDAEVMRYYVRARHEALVAEGFDVPRLLEEARDAPESCDIIRRFLSLARQARTRAVHRVSELG